MGPDVCQCGEVHDALPPPVCLSTAERGADGAIAPLLHTPEEGRAELDAALAEGAILVGSETAFDVLIHAKWHDDPHGALARWADAYEAGCVHDVSVRQKLLDLAAGCYRWITHSDGRRVRVGYDLATTARRNAGMVLDKSGDTYRMRYAELDGVPFERWPDAAIDYALLDAEATLCAFEAQACWRDSKQGARILAAWDGVTIAPWGTAPDPFDDLTSQTIHALWLKMMSAEGLVTDGVAIDRFERRVKRDYARLCDELRHAADGEPALVRREYWRDLAALRAEGSPYAKNRAWAELKAGLDADLPSALAAWSELHAAGRVRLRHKRSMKTARELMLSHCLATGRDVPRTDKFDPRWCEIGDYVAVDSDACRVSEHPKLEAYAELTHAQKCLTSDIPQLRQGVDGTIHTHYEVCLETGRTSSAGPNVQNRARGEGRDGRSGDRECFVPRPGRVLLDYDYAQLELFCLAQACRWAIGYSTLGDALLNNLDPHLDFALEILAADGHSYTYDQAYALYKAKDKIVCDARDAGKGTNFGKPGGLGAKTMVSYAAKAYGVVRTEAQWKELFALWDRKWPEMPEYFAFVTSLETGPRSGSFRVPQMWSGRLRAGATYCAACNSYYQGLGADVAKRAGWYLFKACYVPGIDPELFGCTPVNFIHDQFLIEADEDRAQAAAKRVEHWCGQAARDVLHDYGAKMAEKSDCILARRWSKLASRVEVDGELGVWEDARLLLDDEIAEDAE